MEVGTIPTSVDFGLHKSFRSEPLISLKLSVYSFRCLCKKCKTGSLGTMFSSDPTTNYLQHHICSIILCVCVCVHTVYIYIYICMLHFIICFIYKQYNNFEIIFELLRCCSRFVISIWTFKDPTNQKLYKNLPSYKCLGIAMRHGSQKSDLNCVYWTDN